MKRSSMIILGAAGVLVAAALWPRSQTREEGVGTLVYDSPSDCRAAGLVSAQECEQQFQQASQQVLATAEKFERREDCETQFGAGQCRSATWNGASVFVPAMVGFLLARSLAGGGTPAATQPLFPPRVQDTPCPPGADPQLRPDCQPRQSSSSSPRWSYYSSGSGGTVVRNRDAAVGQMNAAAPRSALASPPARSNVVSRGGFGSTSRSFSSSSRGS